MTATTPSMEPDSGRHRSSHGEPPTDSVANWVTGERQARADAYFDDHLKGQHEQYSRDAAGNKHRSEFLAFIILACGVGVMVVQIFNDLAWALPLTVAFGALVVIAQGLSRVGKYEQTWRGYHLASEAMKREYRLYINGAGSYAPEADEAADEDATYRCFVEQIEAIIAEEQHLFRHHRRKNMPRRSTEKDSRQ